ncbi:DUF5325 family protein [Aquibacillus sediminis]|uniref:DUF5325 family protein n=1 Tax=Aquibacillus sediminis TaxID=2574734 RepID=UPI00148600A6|nr:DUF5325 family protein [Aquibacillus sediminis]
MKSIQYSMLILAMLVILSFAFVGVAIAYRSFWLAVLSLILGFFIMGCGLTLKRKRTQS